MFLTELILLAVGLSMDAFAVSVCKGLSMKKSSIKASLICGIWFGFFQALMPLIGYFLGARFEKMVNAFAPWIAFVLLLIIGVNMLREAFGEEEEEMNPGLDVKTMFIMAVATSIDALAVGITFAMVPVKIMEGSAIVNTLAGVIIIGITTFIISAAGVKIGNIFGDRYKSGAEVVGGVILIFIGLKILLESFESIEIITDGNVIFGMLIPFGGTVLGASLVYVIADKLSEKIQKLFISLSAGIMTGAAVWNLLEPSVNYYSDKESGLIYIMIGFWAGIIFQLILDRNIPHIHSISKQSEGRDAGLKTTVLYMLAEIIHHVPEGIAIGVIYASLFMGNMGITRVEALVLSFGMAIQNFPESVIVSMPIKDSGENNNRSFLMGVLSGAVEPVIGILTIVVLAFVPGIIPPVMAFAAGAIMYLVIEESIPEMSQGGHSNLGVIIFSMGFSFMMLMTFGVK